MAHTWRPPNFTLLAPTAGDAGHVIPASSLVALVAGRGPLGLPLELRHKERSSAAVMDEVRDVTTGDRQFYRRSISGSGSGGQLVAVAVADN